jgi:hypothetical protein
MSGGNSVVESLPSKQMVAGSSPVPRSIVTQGKSGLSRPACGGQGSRENAGRVQEKTELKSKRSEEFQRGVSG